VLEAGNVGAGAANTGGKVVVNRVADTDVLNRGVNDTGALNQVTINSGTVKISDGRDASSANNGTITGESTTNKTSQVRGLTIAAGATLDLNTNDMVYDYSGTSPLQTLRTQLQSGFNSGSWNGTGIISTGAQTGALAAPGHKTAVGYVEASAVRSTFGDASLFSGAAVPDNTTILMRYTYAGDNNVDGTVDLTDFTFLAAHFNQQTGATWIDGDYNYDGKVDLTDFTFLAGNFNAAAFGDSAPAASLGSVVPEPASFGLLGLVAGGLMARRRRRN